MSYSNHVAGSGNGGASSKVDESIMHSAAHNQTGLNASVLLKSVQNGTAEVKSLLSNECDLILECRICRNLFRSVLNFVAHKRSYCRASAAESHRQRLALNEYADDQVTISNHQDRPERPSSTGSCPNPPVQDESPPASQAPIGIRHSASNSNLSGANGNGENRSNTLATKNTCNYFKCLVKRIDACVAEASRNGSAVDHPVITMHALPSITKIVPFTTFESGIQVIKNPSILEKLAPKEQSGADDANDNSGGPVTMVVPQDPGYRLHGMSLRTRRHPDPASAIKEISKQEQQLCERLVVNCAQNCDLASLQCLACKKSFKYLDTMAFHFTACHIDTNVTEVVCLLCGDAFADIQSHLDSSHTDVAAKCDDETGARKKSTLVQCIDGNDVSSITSETAVGQNDGAIKDNDGPSQSAVFISTISVTASSATGSKRALKVRRTAPTFKSVVLRGSLGPKSSTGLLQKTASSGKVASPKAASRTKLQKKPSVKSDLEKKDNQEATAETAPEKMDRMKDANAEEPALTLKAAGMEPRNDSTVGNLTTTEPVADTEIVKESGLMDTENPSTNQKPRKSKPTRSRKAVVRKAVIKPKEEPEDNDHESAPNILNTSQSSTAARNRRVKMWKLERFDVEPTAPKASKESPMDMKIADTILETIKPRSPIKVSPTVVGKEKSASAPTTTDPNTSGSGQVATAAKDKMARRDRKKPKVPLVAPKAKLVVSSRTMRQRTLKSPYNSAEFVNAWPLRKRAIASPHKEQIGKSSIEPTVTKDIKIENQMETEAPVRRSRGRPRKAGRHPRTSRRTQGDGEDKSFTSGSVSPSMSPSDTTLETPASAKTAKAVTSTTTKETIKTESEDSKINNASRRVSMSKQGLLPVIFTQAQKKAVERIICREEKKCTFCDITFASLPNCERHCYSHYGFVRFMCSLCKNVASFYRADVRRHLEKKECPAAKSLGGLKSDEACELIAPMIPEKPGSVVVWPRYQEEMEKAKTGQNGSPTTSGAKAIATTPGDPIHVVAIGQSTAATKRGAVAEPPSTPKPSSESSPKRLRKLSPRRPQVAAVASQEVGTKSDAESPDGNSTPKRLRRSPPRSAPVGAAASEETDNPVNIKDMIRQMVDMTRKSKPALRLIGSPTNSDSKDESS